MNKRKKEKLEEPTPEKKKKIETETEDQDEKIDIKSEPQKTKDNVVFDGPNIAFKARLINEFLVCSLCMGYFRDAFTTKECLHTYCKSCIFRHFKQNTDCPRCGIDLGPNPKERIRFDRTLNEIVTKLFPKILEGDKEPEKKDNQLREVITKAEISTVVDTEKTATLPTNQSKTNNPPKEEKLSNSGYPDEIKFSLIMDDNPAADLTGLTNLKAPFISTSARVTILHLKKFLNLHLKLPVQAFEILFKGEVLGPDNSSLEHILKTMGHKKGEDAVFKYRRNQRN